MSLFDKCRDFTAYRDSIEAGIYPYFHELQSGQAPEVVMEGKRRIMLGSNNYLGLTMHPDVIRAGVEALEKYGSGCSGSRFLNGNLDLHNILERELAEFLGKEACVLLSTGFQSNLGIISAVAGRHDYILSDRENHASIYDGCDLSYAETVRYRHNDMDDLEKRLQKLPREAGKLIVTDGVFSMSGDVCLLPEITELARQYNAAVMVDDAHGFGVLGRGGRGTADHFGLTDKTDIIMGTFSKSLASIGGFMAARPVCDRLCAPQLAALYLQRIHPPRFGCDGSGRPARDQGASGACGTVTVAVRLHAGRPCAARRRDQSLDHADHTVLHL